MDDLERRLADYYDREGDSRLAAPVDRRRIDARTSFIELLDAEERTRLLEVGSGPGRDAKVFADAGIGVFAVDRSFGHVALATAQGLSTVQASAFALPFRPRSFDAAWTMSTLVHVPDERWDVALGALTATLRPGSPLAVGLWGGLDQEGWQPPRNGLPSRFLSLRTHQRAQRMLARHGHLEYFQTWSDERSTWEYQYALLRTPQR